MSTRGLVAAVIWAAVSGAMAAEQPAIRIVVFDQAGVAEPTLRKASETAHWMFHSAGVESDWTLCRSAVDPAEHCVLPPAGQYLQAFVRRNGAGLKRTEDGMGLAVVVKGERRIVCYAFLEPAEALAESVHGSVAVVLAATLAHEVGHLLGLRHSTSGIMKPRLERNEITEAESGRLLFDASGAKALQASARRNLD